jgi:hypothetical protein
MGRAVLAAAFVCATAGVSQAQTTATSTETKSFEVLEVEGHTLVVRLPEGTRELTVPDDFRFTVNGQQLSVTQLKPGMKGTAVVHDAHHRHARHRHRSQERHGRDADRYVDHRPH